MTILLVIHAFVTLALIGVILIQRSDSGGGLGLGGGSGGSGNMFTARGAANLLTRITAVLVAVFFGNCLLMAGIVKHQISKTTSILDKERTEQSEPAEPASPMAPTPGKSN